jgi:hypothetical protein
MGGRNGPISKRRLVANANSTSPVEEPRDVDERPPRRRRQPSERRRFIGGLDLEIEERVEFAIAGLDLRAVLGTLPREKLALHFLHALRPDRGRLFAVDVQHARGMLQSRMTRPAGRDETKGRFRRRRIDEPHQEPSEAFVKVAFLPRGDALIRIDHSPRREIEGEVFGVAVKAIFEMGCAAGDAQERKAIGVEALGVLLVCEAEEGRELAEHEVADFILQFARQQEEESDRDDRDAERRHREKLTVDVALERPPQDAARNRQTAKKDDPAIALRRYDARILLR